MHPWSLHPLLTSQWQLLFSSLSHEWFIPEARCPKRHRVVLPTHHEWIWTTQQERRGINEMQRWTGIVREEKAGRSKLSGFPPFPLWLFPVWSLTSILNNQMSHDGVTKHHLALHQVLIFKLLFCQVSKKCATVAKEISKYTSYSFYMFGRLRLSG